MFHSGTTSTLRAALYGCWIQLLHWASS